MKETIYKFLDDYVGEGATCKHVSTGFRTWTENYEVISDNGVIILWFLVRSEQVKVYRSEQLCAKIEGYFNVHKEESWKYIRDWFGDRHNIQRISDLLKLIVKKEYETT